MYTVYMHKCPNNKVYIGITKISPRERWGKDGSKYSKQLFGYAIKKYGWNNIEHKILFTGLSKEEAETKEVELISKYRSNNRNYGYNICDGGYVNSHSLETREKMSKTRKGRKLSEQHKRALSEAKKGIKATEEHKRNLRKSHLNYIMPQSQKDHISQSCKGKGVKAVIKLSLDGKEIETFSSLNEALESVNGKTTSNISSCCRGRRKNAYGFMWKYKE